MTPPDLAAARHVVLGDAGAEALRRAGAADVVVLRDLLSLGPCHPDPRRHAALRRAFWRAALRDLYPEVLRAADPARSIMGGHELARALARPPRRPVVLWTAPTWPERLALAFAAEALAAEPDAWLASTRSPGASAGAPAQLARALARAVRLGPALAAMAKLWRAYAAPTRAALPHALAAAARSFPDLPRAARFHRDLFPGASHGQVRLSALDRFLLAAHRRPASLRDLVRVHPRSARRFLSALGDVALDVRRHAWAALGALAAVAPAAAPAEARLRLTPLGRRLVREGLPSSDAAPPFHAGGCSVYAEGPWPRRRAKLSP
ncbi:MAG: DUF1835 domain-containing protein [Anaeromyxobacteraceae bacterium]